MQKAQVGGREEKLGMNSMKSSRKQKGTLGKS